MHLDEMQHDIAYRVHAAGTVNVARARDETIALQNDLGVGGGELVEVVPVRCGHFVVQQACLGKEITTCAHGADRCLGMFFQPLQQRGVESQLKQLRGELVFLGRYVKNRSEKELRDLKARVARLERKVG